MLARLDYILAIILFCIGLYTVTMKSNMIKKLIGLNILETAVYLFFIAVGDVRLGSSTSLWAAAPVAADLKSVSAGAMAMVNPIPSALILTAIVVSVSVTALALSVCVRLYQNYGTLDMKKINSLRG